MNGFSLVPTRAHHPTGQAGNPEREMEMGVWAIPEKLGGGSACFSLGHKSSHRDLEMSLLLSLP